MKMETLFYENYFAEIESVNMFDSVEEGRSSGHFITKGHLSCTEAYRYEDEDSGLDMDEFETSFSSSWNSQGSAKNGDALEPEVDITPPRKRRKTETGLTKTDFSHLSSIIRAVDRLSTSADLIADGSRKKCLPITNGGKHKDLSAISSETMADVMEGYYATEVDHVTIIDCRYPYEYEGGHIKGAINLYTKDSIQTFLANTRTPENEVHVVIFHCEFSSERGPKMYRFLRSLDRELNKANYPKLIFPEMYLLEGGYKDFYFTNTVHCEPQSYTPMLHREHKDELRHFRVKSKSWSAGDKVRARPRFNGGVRLCF